MSFGLNAPATGVIAGNVVVLALKLVAIEPEVDLFDEVSISFFDFK